MEQLKSKPEQQEDFLDLARLAKDAGLLNRIMPQPGTVAYDRMIQACHDYILAVDATSMKWDSTSSYARRQKHADLCRMITGKSFENLSLSQRNKISDFASLVASRDDYFGTF